MLKKIIFSLFLALLSTNDIFASTYINEESANEGIRRGATESFASSTGLVVADAEPNITATFNGVLIHPSLILTNRHCLKKYKLTDGSFWAMDNAGEAIKETMSLDTPQERKLYLKKYCARLDLKKVYYPADETIDLAIVGLKSPINEVKIVPLFLEKPKNWSNGFFVSYSPVYSLSNINQVLHENKCHIAILDVTEESMSSPILISKWQLEGNPSDSKNRKFIPQKNEHRLKAFTQESDSGSAFIIKKDKYHVAGIHRGRGVITNEESGEIEVCTLIIPLYPHKTWIENTLKLNQ